MSFTAAAPPLSNTLARQEEKLQGIEISFKKKKKSKL